MADDSLSFVDSPWAQIGVPLAAMAATAIAPRKAGPAAAIGMGAFNSMQDARVRQMRLSQITAQQKADEQRLAEADQLLEAYSEADDTTPDRPAPEGGQAPEADMNARAEALEKGIVAKPTFKFKREEADVYRRLSRVIGPEKVGEMILKDLGEYKSQNMGADPSELIEKLSGLIGKDPNASFSGVPVQGGGTMSYKYDAPPQPTPYADARAGVPPEKLPEFAQNWNKPPEKDAADQIIYDESGAGFWADPKTHQISPMRMGAAIAGQTPSGQTSPAPQPQPSAPPAQQGRSAPVSPSGATPAPAPAPAAAPRPVAAPRGQFSRGRSSGGMNADPTLSDAIADYKTKNPDATPSEISQAAHLMKSGVNTSDLDTLSDMLGRNDPNGLIRMQDAVGRGGAPVRSYILGRTLRKYPDFDPASVDRKIKMLAQYGDPSSRPGRTVQAYNTFLRHAAQATEIVQRYEEAGVPLLNKTLMEVRKDLGGDPQISILLTALNPVKYEYSTFMNGGYALTDHDRQNADLLMPPEATVEQMLGTIQQMGHTAQARMEEQNAFFKRTIGTDIPDAYSPATLKAMEIIGLREPEPPPPPDYRSALTKRKEAAAETATSKSGRPMKKNAQGQWVYAD